MKKWEYKTEGIAAARGLLIDEKNESKIYFCDQQNLIALKASDGTSLLSSVRYAKKLGGLV